jgi:hypothetical protein
MTVSKWRWIASAGTLLLFIAIFLPALEGPSIEGFLGATPVHPLSVGEPAVQTWLGVGRGEQLLCMLALLGCLACIIKEAYRGLRWASGFAIGSLAFGIFAAVSRLHLIIASETGQPENSSFPTPGLDIGWTSQFGFFVLLVSAALLGIATLKLQPARPNRTENSSENTGRSRVAFIGVALVLILGASSIGLYRYQQARSGPAATVGVDHILTPTLVNEGSNSFSKALSNFAFSPDGRFLVATTENDFMVWSLQGNKVPRRPVFRSELGDSARSKLDWTSPHSVWVSSDFRFVYDPITMEWKSEAAPDGPYTQIGESSLAKGNEQLSEGSEKLVPQSHAVVWSLFDATPEGSNNEMRNNNRIAISSLPEGKVFDIPDEMRMTMEPSHVILAPRQPGGRLLAATHNWLSEKTTNRARLRVFDVTASKKLWLKTLPSIYGTFTFSADGRYLVGAGTPRPQMSNGRVIDRWDGFDIWDAESGRVLRALQDKGINGSSLQLNGPKSAVLFFKSGDRTNRFPRLVGRAIPSGKLLLRMEWKAKSRASSEAPKILVAPDGNQVVLGARDALYLVSWQDLVAGRGLKRAKVLKLP